MEPAHFDIITWATFSTHVCSAALRGDFDIEFTHTVTNHTKLLAAVFVCQYEQHRCHRAQLGESHAF